MFEVYFLRIMTTIAVLCLLSISFFNYEINFILCMKFLFNTVAFTAISSILIENKIYKPELMLSLNLVFSIINGIIIDLTFGFLKYIDIFQNKVLILLCFAVSIHYIYNFYYRIVAKYLCKPSRLQE